MTAPLKPSSFSASLGRHWGHKANGWPQWLAKRPFQREAQDQNTF